MLDLTEKVANLFDKHQKQIEDQTIKLMELKHKANTTPCTFKLTNFQQYKITRSAFHSPPFYTSPIGYKMCVRVDANGLGNGEGTHVSVYAYLVKGDNDDSLTWPFTGTVIFELLNQLEDKNHHGMSVTFQAEKYSSQRVVSGERAPKGWGFKQFISHSHLGNQPDKNCQYLKNDTLFFRVSVKLPHNSEPWLQCTMRQLYTYMML